MLYLIATPIGNLKDISLRALDVLEKIDVLLCEDTRNSGKLLQQLGIRNKPKLVSFYDEVEQQRLPEVKRYLDEGLEVGLVSDAGTPLLSDPGWLLVNYCQKNNIAYTALPGASALLNSLVLSGLPAGRFVFLGFLPKKDGERTRLLEQYRDLKLTKIAYESPFRITKLIEEISHVYGPDCDIALTRELTKSFEEVIRGKPEEVVKIVSKKTKGEFVVLFI